VDGGEEAGSGVATPGGSDPGIFLRRTGIETLWPQMLALAIFGVSILTFSVLRFHQRLD
jgi:hypothetical protein